MSNRLKELDLYQKVIQKVRGVFAQLPHNSPLRRDLYQRYCEDLSFKEARKVYGITQAAYYRSKNEDKEAPELMIRYTIGVTREKINKTRLAEIIDQILPQASGRDFRVQSGTNIHWYEKYLKHCKDLSEIEPPVSFSSFYR